MGEADRCIISGLGGRVEKFGSSFGCDGKPLESSDLKLACYMLLKDSCSCCLDSQLFEWKLGNLSEALAIVWMKDGGGGG